MRVCCRWVAARPRVVTLIANLMPLTVVAAEALIALGLAAPSSAGRRRGVRLALLFHLAIAATPPPNGVPTFSCVAAT